MKPSCALTQIAQTTESCPRGCDLIFGMNFFEMPVYEGDNLDIGFTFLASLSKNDVCTCTERKATVSMRKIQRDITSTCLIKQVKRGSYWDSGRSLGRKPRFARCGYSTSATAVFGHEDDQFR